MGRLLAHVSAPASHVFEGICRAGTLKPLCDCQRAQTEGDPMNGLIYLIGLIVVIMAILSFFGLR